MVLRIETEVSTNFYVFDKVGFVKFIPVCTFNSFFGLDSNFIIWILRTILCSSHLILLQHLLFKSVSLLKYNESRRILHGEFLEKLQNSPWRNFANSPWRKCGEILENSP